MELLEQKAREVEETLAELGLQSVPVKRQHSAQGECWLEHLYDRAPPSGVRLLCLHAATDAADFVARAPQLFRKKTLQVVLIGGVARRGAEQFLTPDEEAQNHASAAGPPESEVFGAVKRAPFGPCQGPQTGRPERCEEAAFQARACSARSRARARNARSALRPCGCVEVRPAGVVRAGP